MVSVHALCVSSLALRNSVRMWFRYSEDRRYPRAPGECLAPRGEDAGAGVAIVTSAGGGLVSAGRWDDGVAQQPHRLGNCDGNQAGLRVGVANGVALESDVIMWLFCGS